METTIRLLLAWLVMLATSNAAQAAQPVRDITRSDITPEVQPRVALVIGNKNYTHLPGLSNPINDAQDVAAELERLGFTVMLGTNLDQQQMDDNIRAFGSALSANGVGLFYYAGHAMQFDGSNYLIPTSANVEIDTQIKYKGVNVESVLDAMEARGTAVNLVVLDACRNNPIPRGKRSAGNGLAKMDAPIGTLIAYATRAGKVAEDGAGRNGTFTKYFLKYLGTPGLDLESMLRRVRVDVLAETRNKQYPVADGGLTAEFYFAPASPVSTPSKPIAPAQQLAMLDRAFLTIDAEPRNAHIRIANIGSPYRAGIELAPGDYEVEVTAEGYEPYHALYRVDSGHRTIAVRLKAEPSGPKPGDVFRDRLKSGGEGPEMVVIPPGSFEMGSDDVYDIEKPVHRVTLASAFAMGTTEVTFTDYDRFATAMGRKKPADQGWGRAKRPVIDVVWNDAVAYAQWLSEQTGKRYRLPSEAEWEYATRAGTTTNYWWGSEVGRNNANCRSCGSQWDNQQTAPVKSFERNAFGLYDTAGNVWEWTADCWHENYRDAPKDGTVWKGGECVSRVVRGGSWFDFSERVRSAGRAGGDTAARFNDQGFRLAQDI